MIKYPRKIRKEREEVKKQQLQTFIFEINSFVHLSIKKIINLLSLSSLSYVISKTMKSTRIPWMRQDKNNGWNWEWLERKG